MGNAVEQNEGVFAFVPSYNHGPFVEECLRSIFAQTLHPRKLLVIDDGSRDDSPAIIERVLKDCPFPSELIVRENRGLCRTLNQALALSEGTYFAYIGSDDFWWPEFLQARFDMMERRPNAVLGYGHAYLVDEKGEAFDNTALHAHEWADYPDGDAREMLLKGVAPVSSTIFYRRAVLEKVSWNEDSRLEDYEMYLKLMNLGEFAFDPRLLSAWRHHGYNTSGDHLLMLDEVLAAQERNFDLLGVTRERLDEIQTQTKFRYARIQLQHGKKRSAMKLAGESWRGAESRAQLGKFAARLLVPMPVIEFRRNLRKQQARKRTT
jgi:alpha-1,3-rhamnosyltransferase